MSLSNLQWYGWILLVLSTTVFLNDVVLAARWVKSGDVDAKGSFLWSILGLAIVLYMVTP